MTDHVKVAWDHVLPDSWTERDVCGQLTLCSFRNSIGSTMCLYFKHRRNKDERFHILIQDKDPFKLRTIQLAGMSMVQCRSFMKTSSVCLLLCSIQLLFLLAFRIAATKLVCVGIWSKSLWRQKKHHQRLFQAFLLPPARCLQCTGIKKWLTSFWKTCVSSISVMQRWYLRSLLVNS